MNVEGSNIANFINATFKGIEIRSGNNIFFNNPANSSSFRIVTDATPALLVQNNDGSTCATLSSTSGWSAGSDIRIKSNIVYINSTDALQSVLLLKPTRFTYTGDTDNTLLAGFIAQDIETVPNLIHIVGKGGSDGQGGCYKTLTLNQFIPYLAGAIQEHNSIILQKSTQIATLQADDLIMQSNIKSLQDQLTTANGTIGALQSQLTSLQIQLGQVLQRLAMAGIE